jgi:hypothetical protein
MSYPILGKSAVSKGWIFGETPEAKDSIVLYDLGDGTFELVYYTKYTHNKVSKIYTNLNIAKFDFTTTHAARYGRPFVLC